MMKVKFNTLDAGPNGVREAGSTHDLSEEEAKELVQYGYASYVDYQAASNDPTNFDESHENNAVQIITVDVFTVLKADEQKTVLKYLGIDGDDGNESKRLALYVAYLEQTG
jgi:hypothetical protein